jgi:hypothetical protein
MFRRGMSTLKSNSSAITAWQKSCYHKIDFKINQNSTVYEAVQKFSAYNIGCLAVTNDTNKVAARNQCELCDDDITGLKVTIPTTLVLIIEATNGEYKYYTGDR